MPDREVRSRTVSTNGVDLHLLEAGREGPVVLLAHGFPELAYSWRHQLPALAGRLPGRRPRPAGLRPVEPPRGARGLRHPPPGGRPGGRPRRPGRPRRWSWATTGARWWRATWRCSTPSACGAREHERAPHLPGRHGAHDGAAQRRRRHVLLHALLPGAGRRRRRARRRSARTMRRMLAGAVLRAEAPPDPALFANDGRGSSTGCPSPTACRAGCRPPSSTATSRSSAARASPAA